MKSFKGEFFASLVIILLFLGFGYYYREDINHSLQIIINQVQPCQRPITYSIASIDPRFGLTKEELLSAIEQAEKIWESPVNKQLFKYSPTGDLKISFVYDYRQEATDALKKIGVVIKDDRSTYDTIKAKYDSLVALYNKEKAQGIKSKQDVDSLNALVDNINSTGAILNKLVVTLNLQVDKYNTVGSSNGKQFNEGEYTSDKSGTTINIFEFNDNGQLVRVLAHELGHALGLGHLANPKAIMYYLNEGVNDTLTADDLTALKDKCRIK